MIKKWEVVVHKRSAIPSLPFFQPPADQGCSQRRFLEDRDIKLTASDFSFLRCNLYPHLWSTPLLSPAGTSSVGHDPRRRGALLGLYGQHHRLPLRPLPSKIIKSILSLEKERVWAK